MSNVLNFDVYKNTLKRRDGFSPVGGEFGYSQITCYFQEGDDWEDISIVTAGFYVNSKHVIAENPVIINHSLTVNIPSELLKKHEQIKFGLLGSVQNGNEAVMTIATNIVSIDVARGIVSDEFDQAAAEPGLYDRLIAAVNALLTVKADKTYVDIQNAAQDTVIAGKASKVGNGNADELVSATNGGEIQRSGYGVRNDAGVIKNIESAASILPTARAVGEMFDQVKNAVLFQYAVADNTADPLPDNTVKLKDATDPKIIYIWGNGQGIIIPAVTASQQAQYYLGESGILRYRTRTKVNGAWPDWPSQFTKMETTANKTATINSGSTDEQYPSAKAVYDSVPLFKYAVPNNTGILPANSVRLDDAIDPKVIYSYYNGQGVIIPAVTASRQAQYYLGESGILRYRTRTKVNGAWENWPAQFSTMETTVNKTTTINSASSDTQYPSAKAVYDSVEAVYDKVPLFKYAVPNNTGILPANSVKLDDAIDPKVIYSYNNGQGVIIPAVTASRQAQYYLAEDGVLRYRTRRKVNGVWEDWPSSTNFGVVINEGNLVQKLENSLNPYLSPQNKADKYFVRTCIDKSKVKLNGNTQILGFGDSIMSKGYGGSWMDKVKNRIGCPEPINMAVGGAQFCNNGNNQLSAQLTTFFSKVDNHEIDAAAINLVIIAGGTNDAYNGSPITNFRTYVNNFFNNLQAGFINRIGSCPPVLVITPIRRGKEAEINAADENNIELKIARYSAVLNNLALMNYFSVLNGFDIPVLVDDMFIKGAAAERTQISSFMYKTSDSGDAYDDILHVHPNPTSGVNTYAQAVINAIGFSETPDISGKFDKSKIVKRATDAQVGLTQDTVFSTQAADDYLSYFLRDRPTANQIDATIEEYLDALFLDTVHEDFPSLHIDNTVDQTYNPNGHYIMYYIDSALDRHNIFDFNIGGNVVTSGDDKISMGYDSGGFYFLFDDGQEAVNNGSN